MNMTLSAPTTITLRRPSADADLIISRHDDTVISSSHIDSRTSDLADRQVSYSDPGSASESSPEGSHSSLLDCGMGLEKKKKKKKKRVEERWKCGVRRASDCMRDAIKRFQQQLQLCNEHKSKVNTSCRVSCRITVNTRIEASRLLLIQWLDYRGVYLWLGRRTLMRISCNQCSVHKTKQIRPTSG